MVPRKLWRMTGSLYLGLGLEVVGHPDRHQQVRLELPPLFTCSVQCHLYTVCSKQCALYSDQCIQCTACCVQCAV